MANNDDNRTLGEVIRDARTRAKLGLRELAKKLSISLLPGNCPAQETAGKPMSTRLGFEPVL
jgi:hypothetical protein